MRNNETIKRYAKIYFGEDIKVSESKYVDNVIIEARFSKPVKEYFKLVDLLKLDRFEINNSVFKFEYKNETR